MILWRVSIPLRRKLLLVAIFSLTVIVMAVAIIRVAVVYRSYTKNASLDWLFFWSSIEVATAIIVACLASFRQLFVASQNPSRYGGYDVEKTSDVLQSDQKS